MKQFKPLEKEAYSEEINYNEEERCPDCECLNRVCEWDGCGCECYTCCYDDYLDNEDEVDDIQITTFPIRENTTTSQTGDWHNVPVANSDSVVSYNFNVNIDSDGNITFPNPISYRDED